MDDSVSALSWQTGYFTIDGLGPFIPTIERVLANGGELNAIVGSNDSSTLYEDVNKLIIILGIPSSSALLGLANYSSGLFHPKTYHIERVDGSQAAYVGSANLTPAGLGGLNIEAGLILDSRDGDDPGDLDQIRQAIKSWFTSSRPGFEAITGVADADRLLADGVLALAPPPRVKSSGGTVTTRSRPGLRPLVAIRKSPNSGTSKGASGVSSASGPAPLPASPASPYPGYVLFAPGRMTPTQGYEALSGATLPGGNVGIITKLNLDSARHWLGKTGTANMSIPTAVVGTLRFGMFQGKYARPRAEFEIHLRHLSKHRADALGATNVMVYGFAPGEVGHGDVRLMLSKGVTDGLAAQMLSQGTSMPAVGDIVMIEMPTLADPVVRLTILDPALPITRSVSSMLSSAEASGQLVGRGACWLPAGLSPPW